MIPRFKPPIGVAELATLLRPAAHAAVVEFEEAFARRLQTGPAIAFPYGRSALWAFFKALDIVGAEVVLPAYTCSVVAHAIVLSGNAPRFVDIRLDDYNMDLDAVERAITDRTRAVVATHLFGYPLDVDRLREIVGQAERRHGHRIWIVQDCAHAFGARWRERLVYNEGDVAMFGLGISKTITSIFGGMLTTGERDVAGRVREWRDRTFRSTGVGKSAARRLYLLASMVAFQSPVYGFVTWLDEHTPLLDRFTKAYHLDGEIVFPPDHLDAMSSIEARVGLAQLEIYEDVLRRREAHARYYDEQLNEMPGLQLPPLVAGATYSHYVVRVEDRRAVVHAVSKYGVQLGELIQYSVPHFPAYARYARTDTFPNALYCSSHLINLPVHAQLSDGARQRVVDALHDVTRQMVA